MNIKDLGDLVSMATGNGRMYRKLYGMREGDPPLTVSSWDEWERVPFLTKEDLLRTPIAERSFIPLRDVDYVVPSSGTTGSLPLFSLRAHLLEYDFRSQFCPTPRAVLSSKLVPHQQEWLLKRLGVPARLVVLDPAQPQASARLARLVGVDCMYLMTPHMRAIAPLLVREGIGENITYIEMAGESCTQVLFDYIKKSFPHAVVVSSYGITDVENSAMGVPCHAMDGSEPLETYHASNGCYLELIDLERGTVVPPVAGAEGEVVISAYRGEPAALPMVRYRSGDIARVVETKCEEHGTWLFMLLGRAQMDFIKVPGGMLQADEVERVLRELRGQVSDRFELHAYEVPVAEGVRFRVVLHVEAQADVDLTDLAREVESRLRVGPSLTYAEGVARGRFEPLECVPLSSAQTTRKRKRMFTHGK